MGTDDESESLSLQARLIAGGFEILIATIANLGLAFLVKIAIARTLPTVGYGRVVIGISILTLGRTVVSLGLGEGVTRYLPRRDDDAWQRGVVFSTLQIIIPVSILVSAIIFLADDQIARWIFQDQQVAPIVRIFGIALIFDVLRLFSIRITQGLEQSRPKVLIDTVHPLFRLLLVGLVLLLGYGAGGVAVAYLFANVAGALLALGYLRTQTDLLTLGPAVSLHQDLLQISAPLLVSAITLSLFSNIDLLMLGYFESSGTVGIYSAMYSLATIISFFLVSFEYLYMPAASRLDAAGDRTELDMTYNTVTTWATITTVPTFALLSLAPATFIKFTFGSGYTGGAPALVVIAAAYVISAVLGPNMKTLVSLGYSRSIMIYNVVGFTLNIALNVMLIPRYSFIGASIATLVAYAAMNGCYAVHLYRVADIVPQARIKYILDIAR